MNTKEENKLILGINQLEGMSEKQIRSLVMQGYQVKRKSLEKIIVESEYGNTATPLVDWGEPVGDEVW